MDNQITVDALLAQLPQASAQSSIWKRKAQSSIFLVATGISFVTAVYGFVDAFQHPEKQIVAIGLLAAVIVILTIQLIRAHIVRRKQLQIVHITPITSITSIMINAELQQQLTHQSQLSTRQIWFGRCVRIIDNIGWILLATVLILTAGAVFVFSVFGIYEAIRTGVSIFDVVLLIGLVRPLNSTLNGIKKLQQKKIGTRRRMGTFSKSLHYGIESVNHFIERLHLSSTEFLRTSTTVVSHVGGSIATTVSTVALSVTVSGMGLASAQVAPSAVIATGQVIPLPPMIANMAGPAGHDVAVRGAVFYGCMGNILDGNQHSANENCQQAVQQANDSCAGWQGGPLPPECAQAINQVLPQAVEHIEGTVPQPPADAPNGGAPPPVDPNQPSPNNQPPLNGTPQPQDLNQPGKPQSNSGQAPCVAQDSNTQCPPVQSTANPAANNNNGYPQPPANPNAPQGTPGPNLTPGGQQNPPAPQTTNVPPPPQVTNAPPPPQATNAPPPPQATNVPPPPQATNVPPPPQATDVPAPQATDAPAPQATSAPVQPTANPQPTTSAPPPPPPPPPPRP